MYSDNKCKYFLIVIVKYLLQRLPNNIHILEEIEVFSSENASRPVMIPRTYWN